jgi:hypothetical protein
MFANSLNHAEKSRDTNNLKEASQCGSHGWGNSMIEAYTGNLVGHRAVRIRLKR